MCKRAGTKAVLWNHQNNLCFKPFYRNNAERTLIPSHTHSHTGALLARLPTLARLLKEGRRLTATKLDMAYYSAERRHEYQQLKRYLSQIPWLPASEIGSWGVESINVVRRKCTPTWKRLTGDAGMTLLTYKQGKARRSRHVSPCLDPPPTWCVCPHSCSRLFTLQGAAHSTMHCRH